MPTRKRNRTFSIYRLTVHPFPVAPRVLENKPALIEDAVKLWKPLQLRRGTEWRIGNIERLDNNAIGFRFGYASTTKIARLGPGGRTFVDTDDNVVLYTDVIVDTRAELCGVAHDSGLPINSDGVARRLARLLSNTPQAQEDMYEFQVHPIAESGSFLTRLERAYAIRRLAITVYRPNPWDVDKDFVEPTSRTTEAIGAEAATTTWLARGRDGSLTLADPLREIISSTAAIGGEAVASVKETKRARTKQVRLQENKAEVSVSSDLSLSSVLDYIRSRYNAVRKGAADGDP